MYCPRKLPYFSKSRQVPISKAYSWINSALYSIDGASNFMQCMVDGPKINWVQILTVFGFRLHLVCHHR